MSEETKPVQPVVPTNTPTLPLPKDVPESGEPKTGGNRLPFWGDAPQGGELKKGFERPPSNPEAPPPKETK